LDPSDIFKNKDLFPLSTKNISAISKLDLARKNKIAQTKYTSGVCDEVEVPPPLPWAFSSGLQSSANFKQYQNSTLKVLTIEKPKTGTVYPDIINFLRRF
jgi:hypothetical protein